MAVTARPRQPAPPGEPRRGRGLRLAALVVVVAVIAAGAWLAGRTTAPSPSGEAQGPGPTGTEAGVPVGYAHTEAGAAAAALNLLAALYGPGLDPEQQDRVLGVLAADGAKEWITDHLAEIDARPLPEDFEGRVWRWAPVGYDVTSYSDDTAVVEVWGSTARTSQTGRSFANNAGLLTRMELVWESGDWRVSQVGAPELPREGLDEDLDAMDGVWHAPPR